MKKRKQRTEPPWHLPNHVWYPADWARSDDARIVRNIPQGVLIRTRSWGEAKEGTRYNWSKEFCGESRPNDTWKPFDLSQWSDTCIRILAQKAKDGSGDAAMELAGLAGIATLLLTKVCESNPALVQPLARLRHAWPVIKGKREALSGPEKTLFAQIQLGQDSILELDAQSSKWVLDDAGKVAYGLLKYIQRARENPSEYGTIGDFMRKELKGDFTDKTAPQWWDAAKGVLLLSYPDPQDVEEFNQLVTAESKRKSPGRIRQAIFDILKARFLSFARNDYYQT